MRRHARHRETARRVAPGVQITPAAPFGIGNDCLPADLVERDVLRRMPRRAGDRHRGEDALGIARGPLQDLHRAHRAADDGEQGIDAEMLEQQLLRPHHVVDRDDPAIEPERFAHNEAVARPLLAGALQQGCGYDRQCSALSPDLRGPAKMWLREPPPCRLGGLAREWHYAMSMFSLILQGHNSTTSRPRAAN